MSTVTVIKSQKSGKVLNASTNNPLEGWIMIESTSLEFKGGRRFENKRRGFLRQQVALLQSLDLKADFAMLLSKGVDTTGLVVLQPKGFAEGQVLPGRVVIQDSLEPIIADNLEFGLRVPQLGANSDIRNAVREACSNAGLAYTQSGKPIYRKTFYSPYPEGHPRCENDIILSPDNMDEVNAFIATIQLPSANTGLDVARKARLAELQGTPQAQRTANQKAELAELLD